MTGRKGAVLRSVAVLVVTLMIGVVMGAAIMGNVIRHRVTEIQQFTSAEGFKLQMMSLIEPMNASQADAVTAIVDAHGDTFGKRIAANRAEFFLSLERLDTELAPLLTPDQKQRIAAHRESLKSRINRYGSDDE
ncbi:MAG: hypothetical protein AAGM16_07070 [Pseudomonadota bacterium]